jgi:hypothetical protein
VLLMVISLVLGILALVYRFVLPLRQQVAL